MIKYIGIGVAGLALVGCTQVTPAPVVTVTAPAPTVTVPAPVATSNEDQDAMEYAWSTLTSSERSDVCALFNYDPQGAWDAFDDGAQGAVSQSVFIMFLNEKCGQF
jgi:hypothetical protein